jgi:hypothetical protein
VLREGRDEEEPAIEIVKIERIPDEWAYGIVHRAKWEIRNRRGEAGRRGAGRLTKG